MKRNGVFFGVVALTAFACGGIDEPNFFSSTGTTTTTHDSGASSGGDGGNSNFSDSGTVTTFDSGVTVTADAGVTPPVDPGIFCGSGTYCNPSSQFCCASGQDLGTPDFACGTNKNDCTDNALGGLVIPCDDTAECGGQFCCGTYDNSTQTYSQVRCQSSCGGTQARIFCDPANGNADCGGVGTCGDSSTLPGFHVCTK
ncbi:MAG: hypothetical protein ABI183_08875 [Polyangiaceae bacterium]